MFKAGDKIKFRVSGRSLPHFYGEDRVPKQYIVHGQTAFLKNEGEVVAVLDNGIVVVSFIDYKNNKVQLGFDEKNLELVEKSKRVFTISYLTNEGTNKKIKEESTSLDDLVSSLKDFKKINYLIEE